LVGVTDTPSSAASTEGQDDERTREKDSFPSFSPVPSLDFRQVTVDLHFGFAIFFLILHFVERQSFTTRKKRKTSCFLFTMCVWCILIFFDRVSKKRVLF
jgi:hypothetical protein